LVGALYARRTNHAANTPPRYNSQPLYPPLM
jgi:hypothetical protein